MDFITIDFETANPDRGTPCEMALTFVKDFQIIETKSWLIKPFTYPHFHHYNVYIHGISPSDVADKPYFNELWDEVSPLIQGQFLIAHNAAFDFSVLRKTLDYYKLPYPKLKYACSYFFSKNVWPELPAYDLKTLCKYQEIALKHHRAANDCHATAELAIKAFKNKDIYSIQDITKKLDITIGELFEGGYTPSSRKQKIKNSYSKISTYISVEITKTDPENIFYGKTVVFTGVLSSMTRQLAEQTIINIGGLISKTITTKTDFLIVGFQDYKIVGEDGLSTKQEKAIKLREKGYNIEVLSEDDFLKNVNND